MRPASNFLIGIATIIIALLMSSCSGSGKNILSPAEPKNQVPSIPDIPAAINPDNHFVMASYDAVIDPEAKTFSITPSRTVDFHFPLTNLYPNVLKITAYGWSPNFWADIKLTHPFPGSGIDAFDPRVIAILPENPGVSMNYPNLNIHGNNAVVMYPDAYTTLFDKLDFEGNVNPFMAYFTRTPNRLWSSTGYTTETIRWDLNLGGFGGPIRFKLIVDVSTNYPNPPQPVIDNAKEPVAIQANVGTGLTSSGGSAQIAVTLLDWQGTTGIGGVVIEAPNLFNGIQWLSYSGQGPNPYEYVYAGTITNELLAGAGDYNFVVATWDQTNGVFIIREFIATVAPGSLNPVDITPPSLNITPLRVAFQSPFVYVAAGFQGFHVFHLGSPSNIEWISKIPTDGYASEIAVDGNYAYLADNWGGLVIIDISNPYQPSVVNIISFQGQVYDVKVRDGYAFVAVTDYFYIFDMTTPQSPVAIKAVANSNCDCIAIDINRDYAYIVSMDSLDDEVILTIYDIDPLASAYEVGRLNLGYGTSHDIAVFNGYAYVLTSSVVDVVDINPPQSPTYLDYFTLSGAPNSCQIKGNYAYFATYSGVDVVDITTPGSETIVNTIETPGIPIDALATDSLGLIASANGLGTFDASSPGFEYLIVYQPYIGNVWSVETYGNMLYYSGGYFGPNAYSIADPEFPVYLKSIPDDTNAGGLFADGGYLYYSCNNGLEIMDVTPIETASIIKTINPPNTYRGVCVRDGYAYVADEYSGLRIIDIDPPETAYLVKTVDTTAGGAMAVDAFNGYAYVANLYAGLMIVDVDPPESAYIVKEVPTNCAEDVKFQSGFAYVADYTDGLVIVKVEPPSTAYVFKTVPISYETWALDLNTDYAFMATKWGGIQIVDINPPSDASIVSSVSTGYWALDVKVYGNYIYCADTMYGIRIIKLW